VDTTYQLTFWPDRPTSRGCFHNVSLDLASLTFYQPLVEFSSHSDHFHISNQLTLLVKSTNLRRWFSQTESGFDLSNLLQQFLGHSNYLLWTSSHEHHIYAYPLFLLSNAFFCTTSQAVRCTFLVTHSIPTSCQH
jgi:hypothetical protein